MIPVGRSLSPRAAALSLLLHAAGVGGVAALSWERPAETEPPLAVLVALSLSEAASPEPLTEAALDRTEAAAAEDPPHPVDPPPQQAPEPTPKPTPEPIAAAPPPDSTPPPAPTPLPPKPKPAPPPKPRPIPAAASPSRAPTATPASVGGSDPATPLATAPAPPPAPEPYVPPSSRAAYLNNPPPAYPTLCRRLGQEGVVVLAVDVDDAGRPTAVRLARSSGVPALDEAALRAVAGWRFTPASRGGRPVPATVETPIRFSLAG